MIYLKGGAKMMRPVLSRDEYMALRNGGRQRSYVAAVRSGDEKKKSKLVQMNYSCLPCKDGALKGSTQMSTTVGMDIDHVAPKDMQPLKERILGKAEQLGLLVVFHAGADIGLPPPVYTSPKKIRHALDYVGGSNLIAAHLGGWAQWDDVEACLVGTPVHLDTAYIAQFIDPAQCLRIIRNHGAEKIVFGSDSPWEDPADTLRFLESLGLNETELSLITHENALRLLGEKDT